jgi:hypothetical protein
MANKPDFHLTLDELHEMHSLDYKATVRAACFRSILIDAQSRRIHPRNFRREMYLGVRSFDVGLRLVSDTLLE